MVAAFHEISVFSHRLVPEDFLLLQLLVTSDVFAMTSHQSEDSIKISFHRGLQSKSNPTSSSLRLVLHIL